MAFQYDLRKLNMTMTDTTTATTVVTMTDTTTMTVAGPHAMGKVWDIQSDTDLPSGYLT